MLLLSDPDAFEESKGHFERGEFKAPEPLSNSYRGWHCTYDRDCNWGLHLLAGKISPYTFGKIRTVIFFAQGNNRYKLLIFSHLLPPGLTWYMSIHNKIHLSRRYLNCTTLLSFFHFEFLIDFFWTQLLCLSNLTFKPQFLLVKFLSIFLLEYQ